MIYIQHAYSSFIWLRYLFWRKSLFCASQGQRTASSEYASVLEQNHWLSLFPTHPPACAHVPPPPHPSWIPAAACCSPRSSALQRRLSPIPRTSPLLPRDRNLNPDTWFLSNTDRSKPCIGAELVKSHRVASVAGGIMPGIAMGHPAESVAKCQSSGFMNAIHRVPRLLAFSKACCKSLPPSSMHTLREKAHFFLSALPEQR